MIKGISHIGFDVKNMEAMLDFYCNALGMKKKFSMTFSQALRKMQSEPQAEMNEELTEFMQYLGQMGDKEWFVYLEMAPNQLIELFYQYGEKKELPDIKQYYGYQHFSLEVDNIHELWDRVCQYGIKPDSPIRKGVDGTYQFWLTDPDGNHFEVMEYTKESLQITGDE